MQNGVCEAFNGRMRDELLNETLFRSLDHAREAVARWVADYNHRRPHSALGYDTPAAFAAQIATTAIRCARWKGSAHRPLLTPRKSAKPPVRLQLPVDDQRGSQQPRVGSFLQKKSRKLAMSRTGLPASAAAKVLASSKNRESPH